MKTLSLTIFLNFCFAASSAWAGSTVSPFGYGTVGQYLVQPSDAHQTGALWCATKYGTASAPWRCTGVSGANGSTANTCGSTVPSNEIVSCSPFIKIENITASNTAGGQTGQWWCDLGLGLNLSGNWQCLNVNGSTTACTQTATQGQTIACGEYTVVHDTGFQYPGFMSTPEPYQVPSNSPAKTGQAWCDAMFTVPKGGTYLCSSVDLGTCTTNVTIGATVMCAEVKAPIPLSSPYTGGQTPAQGQTGQWFCSQTPINNDFYGAQTGYGWMCLNMRDSNNNLLPCSTPISPGTTTYCQPTHNGSLIETANCGTGSGLGALDTGFCPVTAGPYPGGGIGGYGAMRRTDTYYLFNDYVRVGVNTAFGGTIFELYGTDMRNRILEAGGGAMQLSLYAEDPNTVPKLCFLDGTCQTEAVNADGSCNASSGQSWRVWPAGAAVADCKTVLPCNGVSSGWPWNPVQTQSVYTPSGGATQCAYDASPNSLDSVKPSASLTVTGNPPQSTSLQVSRANPYQFTKSVTFAGLQWFQTVTVVPGAPYVKVSYTVDWQSTANSTNGLAGVSSTNSELPALFLKPTFTSPTIYFTTTMAPYSNASGPVNCPGTSACTAGMQLVYLGAKTPSSPSTPTNEPSELATEAWASVCDSSTPQACMTLATFSPNLAIQYTPSGSNGNQAAYMGIYGYFNLGTSFSGSFTLYAFPYRYDDIIGGTSVRQWIYNLRGS